MTRIHVLDETDLLDALKRAFAGEDPGILLAEMTANGDTEELIGEEDENGP